ncbi:MAG: peptidoglycan-binding protein [Cellvibrio sp. 79]|nr:MAG: peptidoglycan-binding protein [Cellvibrio sp. 79]
MNTGITKSVGAKGANERVDVIFIQSALNAHANFHKATIPPLKVDGRCGLKTIEAIKIFQKDYVGIKNPDSRIDPNGKTLRYLTMYLTTPNLTAKKPLQLSTSLIGFDNINVTYSSDIDENRRIVSSYAINVIKIALKECGMNQAVITSTLRTPEDQAAIMYKNAKANFEKQKDLYGKNGDDVLEVFKENKSKPKDEVIELMKDKIEKLLEKDKKVSNHCITVESFKKMNTFDIGLKSTKAKSKNFNKEKLTKAFKDLESQGYIKHLIDETMKSNSCWHLEIVPNTKSLNTYGKESMLLPTKYINGAYV